MGRLDYFFANPRYGWKNQPHESPLDIAERSGRGVKRTASQTTRPAKRVKVPSEPTGGELPDISGIFAYLTDLNQRVNAGMDRVNAGMPDFNADLSWLTNSLAGAGRSTANFFTDPSATPYASWTDSPFEALSDALNTRRWLPGSIYHGLQSYIHGGMAGYHNLPTGSIPAIIGSALLGSKFPTLQPLLALGISSLAGPGAGSLLAPLATAALTGLGSRLWGPPGTSHPSVGGVSRPLLQLLQYHRANNIPVPPSLLNAMSSAMNAHPGVFGNPQEVSRSEALHGIQHATGAMSLDIVNKRARMKLADVEQLYRTRGYKEWKIKALITLTVGIPSHRLPGYAYAQGVLGGGAFDSLLTDTRAAVAANLSFLQTVFYPDELLRLRQFSEGKRPGESSNPGLPTQTVLPMVGYRHATRQRMNENLSPWRNLTGPDVHRNPNDPNDPIRGWVFTRVPHQGNFLEEENITPVPIVAPNFNNTLAQQNLQEVLKGKKLIMQTPTHAQYPTNQAFQRLQQNAALLRSKVAMKRPGAIFKSHNFDIPTTLSTENPYALIYSGAKGRVPIDTRTLINNLHLIQNIFRTRELTGGLNEIEDFNAFVQELVPPEYVNPILETIRILSPDELSTFGMDPVVFENIKNRWKPGFRGMMDQVKNVFAPKRFVPTVQEQGFAQLFRNTGHLGIVHPGILGPDQDAPTYYTADAPTPDQLPDPLASPSPPLSPFASRPTGPTVQNDPRGGALYTDPFRTPLRDPFSYGSPYYHGAPTPRRPAQPKNQYYYGPSNMRAVNIFDFYGHPGYGSMLNYPQEALPFTIGIRPNSAAHLRELMNMDTLPLADWSLLSGENRLMKTRYEFGNHGMFLPTASPGVHYLKALIDPIVKGLLDRLLGPTNVQPSMLPLPSYNPFWQPAMRLVNPLDQRPIPEGNFHIPTEREEQIIPQVPLPPPPAMEIPSAPPIEDPMEDQLPPEALAMADQLPEAPRPNQDPPPLPPNAPPDPTRADDSDLRPPLFEPALVRMTMTQLTRKNALQRKLTALKRARTRLNRRRAINPDIIRAEDVDRQIRLLEAKLSVYTDPFDRDKKRREFTREELEGPDPEIGRNGEPQLAPAGQVLEAPTPPAARDVLLPVPTATPPAARDVLLPTPTAPLPDLPSSRDTLLPAPTAPPPSRAGTPAPKAGTSTGRRTPYGSRTFRQSSRTRRNVPRESVTDDESLPDVTDLINYIGGRPRGSFRRLEIDPVNDDDSDEDDDRRPRRSLRHRNLRTIDLDELDDVLKEVNSGSNRSGSGIISARTGGRANGNSRKINFLKNNITDEEARNVIVYQQGIIVPRTGKGGRLTAKLFKEDMSAKECFSNEEYMEILTKTLKSLQKFKGPVGKEWLRSFQHEGNFLLLTQNPNEWVAYVCRDDGRVLRKPLCKPFRLPESLDEKPPNLNQLQLHFFSLLLSCLRVSLPSWVDVDSTFNSAHLHRPGHLLYQGGHRYNRQ